MNRLGIILACLWAALRLTTTPAQAETAVWFDNFETNAASRWSSTGAWRITAPTAGPKVGPSGYRSYSGTHCATTQNYGTDQDSRIICHNYNGQTFLTVPSADQMPRLRFWHWFNLANAIGFVEISTDGVNWSQISPTYSYAATPTSAVWSRPYFDLGAYAGQNIQIAFHFYGGPSGNALGWDVDDVGVFTGTPVLDFPESFEQGQGDWSVTMGTWEIGKPTSGPWGGHTGTNCAATVLAGNYPNHVDSQLVSPPFQVPTNAPQLRFFQWYSLNGAVAFVEVNNGFTTTTSVTNITVTTNTAGTFDTNVYTLSGAGVPGYTNSFYWNPTIGGWTNSQNRALGNVFDLNYQGSGVSGYYYETGLAPFAGIGGGDVDYYASILPFPDTADPTNITAWQGMKWNSALGNISDSPVGYFASTTNSQYVTNITITTTATSWTQISPTYQSGSSGGVWQPVSLDLSAFANQTVQLAFHFGSGGLATAPGWYVDDISVVAAPELIVPTNEIVQAGDELMVTVSATNTYLPNATYTYKLLTGPTNASITSQGVITWQTQTNQLSSTNTFVVQATDNSSPAYVVTNSFQVIVQNQGIPALIVPPTQLIFAGQTLTVTNYGTNSFFPDDTFTFALASGLTNAASGLDRSELTNNGVLTWFTKTNLAAGNYTNKVVVTDGMSGLTATNSFVITVSNAPAPGLQVPGTQKIFAGQTLTVTNIATSPYGASSTFTFTLMSALTNSAAGLNVMQSSNNLVLSWATTTSLMATNYTNKVSVLDSVSGRSATNSFVVVVSNAPAPALIVPPTQTLYPGQSLTVTNTASSPYGTNSVFTFALLSGLTNAAAGLNLSGLTNHGVLSWATSNSVPVANYTNKVTVLDSVSQRSATNSFVVVIAKPPPPTLHVPSTQTLYPGAVLSVTNTATSVYGTNTTLTFALLSGLSLPAAGLNVSALASQGILTWVSKTNLAAGNYTNTITVLDAMSQLTSTNSFVVSVVTNAPPAPTLIVPANQLIYAGEKLTVTNVATSVYGTNTTFTYSLISSLTNASAGLNELNFTNLGILVWATKTSLTPATYTNVVTAVDNLSGRSATNRFNVQVLPPQPPTLTVPPTQLVYAGQLLMVTNTASSVYPGDTFTFAAVGPTNLDISNLPQNGVISWIPLASQAPSENIIWVQVTDSESLSALTNFLVLVAVPPSPQLSAAPGPKAGGGSAFEFTLSAQPNSTWRIEATTNFNAPATNWFPIYTNMTGPSGALNFTDILATNFPQRFYRAVFP